MTVKYSHPIDIANLASPQGLDYVDFTNITGLHDVGDTGPSVFDTGGNTGIVIAANVTGTVYGTSPVLRLRIDHSVDGITFEELWEFASWNGEAGFQTFSIPAVSGPLTCAQYLRVMMKIEGTSAAFTSLTVKASLKG